MGKRAHLPTYGGDVLCTLDEFEQNTGIRLDECPASLSAQLELADDAAQKMVEAAAIAVSLGPAAYSQYLARLRELWLR